MNRLLVTSVAVIGLGFLSPPETRSSAFTDNNAAGGGETITRAGDTISGDMVIGAKHVHYEGRIASDGTIPRLDMRVWRSAAEAKHPRLLSAVVGSNSTMLIQQLGNKVDTARFASQPGMLPLINPSVGLIEVLVARARPQKSRPARVPILFIDALHLDAPTTDKVGAAPRAIDVTFLAADTVKLGNGPSTDQMRVIIGADGRSRGGVSGSTAKDKFSFWPTSKAVPR
jgi:hypothetical protein